MSFETFLQFWTLHNRQIIEFVFVFTFVLILFIIYRQFFSKSESMAGSGHHANSVSIDTSEIEEKLKKILENQGALKTQAPDTKATNVTEGANPAIGASAPGGSDGGFSSPDLEKLKADLKEKEKVIEELKKSTGAAPGAGASTEDAKKWQEKIKELEGRLQEYEIISEDIADLSFYKEENARLQKELVEKGAAAPAANTSPPVSAESAPIAPETPAKAAAPLAAEVPVVPEAAAVVETPTLTSAKTPAAMASPAPPEIAAEKKEINAVVDDDILKEFAAAVEGQKKSEANAVAAEPTPAIQPLPPVQEVDPQKLTESKELMGEFENFIKKG